MAGRDRLARELHPELAPWAAWLYDVAAYYGLAPRVTSVYRSRAYQAQLYAKWSALRNAGLSNQQIGQGYGLWTPLPPGRSLHEYGLAFDMAVKDPAGLGEVWRSVGGYWAGPSDPVHFAVTRSIDDLL